MVIDDFVVGLEMRLNLLMDQHRAADGLPREMVYHRLCLEYEVYEHYLGWHREVLAPQRARINEYMSSLDPLYAERWRVVKGGGSD